MTGPLPPALDAAPQRESFEAVWQALWAQPHLPAQVLGLCQLRLVTLHRATDTGLPSSIALPPEKSAAVLAGRAAEASVLSPGEKAALEFTELYAMDPAAIGDDEAAAVKAAFGNAGLIALIEFLGFADGRLRLQRLFASAP